MKTFWTDDWKNHKPALIALTIMKAIKWWVVINVAVMIYLGVEVVFAPELITHLMQSLLPKIKETFLLQSPFWALLLTLLDISGLIIMRRFGNFPV